MGGMDKKVRKILDYLKKRGGDLEVIDFAFALNLDEGIVQNGLDALEKDGLAASRRNEQGKTLWSMPAGDTAPKEKPAKEEKTKKGKNKAEAESDSDEFVLEDMVASIATETIASVEEFLPKASPTPAAQPPDEFDLEDFSPKEPVTPTQSAPPPPKEPEPEDFSPKEPAAPPPADDDFEPKKKKVKEKKEKAPDLSDDFEPKPEKKKEIREAINNEIADNEHTPKQSSKNMLPIAAIAGSVILILIIVMAAGGSGKKAKTAAESIKTELSGQIEAIKTDYDAKIKALEEKNQSLEKEITSLKEEIKKTGQTDKSAPKKKKK